MQAVTALSCHLGPFCDSSWCPWSNSNIWAELALTCRILDVFFDHEQRAVASAGQLGLLAFAFHPPSA
jgi:hypothetical protein